MPLFSAFAFAAEVVVFVVLVVVVVPRGFASFFAGGDRFAFERTGDRLRNTLGDGI